MSPVFTHEGTSFGYGHQVLPPKYKVKLNALPVGATKTTCSLADAALLDVGYVLSHEDELVQVCGLAGITGRGHDLKDPSRYYEVHLYRGYNGSPVKRHKAATWPIEFVPRTEFEARLPRRDVATCGTCGAPDQTAGERCHYCIHVVKA
jgi:hypothetical protein